MFLGGGVVVDRVRSEEPGNALVRDASRVRR